MSRELRTCTFTAVLETEDGMWHGYCPTLLAYGAATRGATREEVLGHIREVVGMIVERLAEEGASMPAAPANQEPATGGADRGHGPCAARGRAASGVNRPPRVIHRTGEKPVHGGGDVHRAFGGRHSRPGRLIRF